MDNIINARITLAQTNLRRAENEKVKAETQLGTAKENLDKITAEMTAHGVTPETIVAKITELEQQVAKDLDTVEKLMPQVQ